MAHEILGNRFMSRVRPAWHNLGVIFPADEVVKPSDAVRRVAGDVDVVEAPVFTQLPGNDDHVVIPGRRMIVRMPTDDAKEPGFLGMVTDRWHKTSYVDLALPLDRIDHGIYKVETAGVIEDGARCFLSLRGEDWAVLGTDEMQTYFVVMLSLQPGVGHVVRHTPVRVVCKNTATLAEAKSNIALNVPHGADAAQQIGLCGDLLVRFKEAQAETQRIFDTFAKTQAPVGAVERVIAAAYPEPKAPAKLRLFQNVVGHEATEVMKQQLDPQALASMVDAQERHDKHCEKMGRLREAALEQFERFEPESMRGTLWAAYNGVTEIADWREGHGKNVDRSTMFGSRAAEKSRAFAECMAIVEGK